MGQALSSRNGIDRPEPTMGQLARRLMKEDEKENHDAYVAMGEVQLDNDPEN